MPAYIFALPERRLIWPLAKVLSKLRGRKDFGQAEICIIKCESTLAARTSWQESARSRGHTHVFVNVRHTEGLGEEGIR